MSSTGSRTRAEEDGHRSLPAGTKRLLALLGVPTFAFALAVTVVTTYLPVAARNVTSSSAATGLLIATEGVLALWLPVFAGTWSDRVATRLGGRLPFMLAAAPAMAAGLLLMAAGGSFALFAIAAAIFFAGYFVAYEPYRALYPDAVPHAAAGRSQSTQAVWRGLGTACALVGGGFLLAAGQAVPFSVAAAIVVACTLGFTAVLVRIGIPSQGSGEPRGTRAAIRALLRLVRESPPLRAFFVANALWELSLSALKTFVVLYLVRGLGYELTTAAAVIGAVSVFVLVGAVAGGRLGDRFGKTRTMLYAAPLYGAGLLVPFAVHDPLLVGIVAPVVAIGGGFVMTLPYAILMPLMPDEQHGSLTGFFSMSRGLGAMLGPVLAGAAVDLLSGAMTATDGYAGAWLVAGLGALASVPFVWRLRRATA